MTIRTPEGFETAEKGDIIFFEMGRTGAHQFFNHDNVPCEYLDLRTTVGVDVSEYPDSGKIGIWPFGDILKKESQVDYNEGEENVQLIWKNLKRKK